MPEGVTRAATLLVLASVTAVVAVPVLALVRTAWVEGRGQLRDVLTGPGFGRDVAHTFELAAVVTVLALALGVAMAVALRRPQLPGRSLLRWGVLLPVLVPDFVLAYSWLRAYGRAGFTDQLLERPWAGVQGAVGVAVVVTVNAVPLVYLVASAGLAARAEPALERAARASGAGELTVLRTITLPLLRPAIGVAAVLVFVLTLGTFAVPQVMGTPAGFATISTRIYADLSLGSDPRTFVEAVVLAVFLVAVTLVLVAPADLVWAARLKVTRTSGADGQWPGVRRHRDLAAAAAIWGYLLLTTVLPLVALVSSAVTRAVGVASVPSNWTVDNFAAVWTLRNAEAAGRSLLLASAAASILVVLGGCAAALERTRAGRGVGVLVTMTLVLPGSTLAIGLLISYGRWLADTPTIILLAYLSKLWAVAHRPISGALDRLPPEELRAARVSGADLVTGLSTAVLPSIRFALLAAWGLCFLTALHEVTMSSLLYGPGGETLAVVVLNSADLGRVGATSALSVTVTLLVSVPALVLWATLRRVRDAARRGRG